MATRSQLRSIADDLMMSSWVLAGIGWLLLAAEDELTSSSKECAQLAFEHAVAMSTAHERVMAVLEDVEQLARSLPETA